jgi:hypothetical protein
MLMVPYIMLIFCTRNIWLNVDVHNFNLHVFLRAVTSIVAVLFKNMHFESKQIFSLCDTPLAVL